MLPTGQCEAYAAGMGIPVEFLSTEAKARAKAGVILGTIVKNRQGGGAENINILPRRFWRRHKGIALDA